MGGAVTFANLQQTHQTFIAGHVLSETVEYLEADGNGRWRQLSAMVRRPSVDSLSGEVLRGQVLLDVSKADLATVHRRRDYVRLLDDEDRADVAPPQYKVMDATELPGGFRLRCEKVR